MILAVAFGLGTATVGGSGHARAATTPAAPVSVGTTTVSTAGGNETFTLTGTIVVGSGAFTGTASGTTPLPGPFSVVKAPNPIAPFALSGPGLTGTCSGLWLADPTGGYVDEAEFAPLPPSPVNVVELACSLQLGVAPAAQTSLTLAVVAVDPPADREYAGVYGPGFSNLPVAVPASRGLADQSFVFESENTTTYDLVGDISLGGGVFHGHASGSYTGAPPSTPFALAGTSPSGDLSATCTDSVPLEQPLSDTGLGVNEGLVTLLSCTGAVGAGPTGTTTLILLLPLTSTHVGAPCGHCTTDDATGVFLG